MVHRDPCILRIRCSPHFADLVHVGQIATYGEILSNVVVILCLFIVSLSTFESFLIFGCGFVIASPSLDIESVSLQ